MSSIVSQDRDDELALQRAAGQTGALSVQRGGPLVALKAAEWIAIGTAGYSVAKDAVNNTSGDITYKFDEMEGVLLPTGGNDVAAYRASHPDTQIREYEHKVSIWMGTSGSRKMGIKFGIRFSYDGHAIGSISCRILDTFDWPMWGGSVDVNFTPLSLASGDVASVRITLNVNSDRTFLGGSSGSRVLKLDARGTISEVGFRPGSGTYLRFE